MMTRRAAKPPPEPPQSEQASEFPLEAMPDDARCDRCGHEARVMFRHRYADRAELAFCGHHSTENEIGLAVSGWVVVAKGAEWE